MFAFCSWNRELRSKELVRSERDDDKRWYVAVFDLCFQRGRFPVWRQIQPQLQLLRPKALPRFTRYFVCRNERHASWRIEKDQLKDLRVGYVPDKNAR